MADNRQEAPAETVRGKKKKTPGRGRFFFVCLLLITLGIAGYSGYKVYSDIAERKEGIDAYNEISAGIRPNTGEAANVDTRIQIELDFDELVAINSDIIGWVVQDTSVINYPIVQHTDNEYYLNHLFTGEWNHTGCVFTDKDAAPDFSDRNTPLYAHGRRDGTMFGTLEKYESQEYYDAHPSFLLITKDENVYLVEPFAGSINDAGVPFLRAEFADTQDFADYVAYWLYTSTFQSKNRVTTQDKIITMLTCSDDFEDARYALFCTMRDANDRYVVVKKTAAK